MLMRTCRTVLAAIVAGSARSRPDAAAAARHAEVRPAAARAATSSTRKNNISAVRDVAIADGKIAAVAARHRSRRRRCKIVDVVRPLRDARPDRHPRPRLRRHRRAGLLRRRQQRLPRRLHVPRRRHHGGRRRRRRAGATSRTSRTASSTARRRACSRSSTSSATACAAASSSRTSPTWTPSRPPRWRCKHKGLIVGIKTAHYAGPGVDAGRARGRGGHASPTSR